MILLLDIGNSRVKWGLLSEGTLQKVDALPYRDIQTIAEKHWRSQLSPSRILASHVAGPIVATALETWIWSAWHKPVEFLIPQAEAFGVINGYRDPKRLGADRWAALLGASQQPHGHLCVVDCGTALTIDLLRSDNVHCGGLIVPGLRLMREALIHGTAGITDSLGNESKFLARDTGSAVAGGTLYTTVALIDRVMIDMTELLKREVTVLLTGGDASLIAPLLSKPSEIHPNLVLQGLMIVAHSTK